MQVSVIIPMYNAEHYISRAVESCLALKEVQEIILVDDGFKDNTLVIAQQFAEKHSHIKIFQHPNGVNKGAGPSRNLGIEKATKEYIAFLDADDFFLPVRFEKDKRVFAQFPIADGCYNAIGAHFYSEEAKSQFFKSFNTAVTTIKESLKPSPENLFDSLLRFKYKIGYFSLIGLTIKRQSLIKSGINFDSLRIHQDTAFLLKLAYKTSLHPSELSTAVALRGVHLKNRITANNNDSQHVKAENQLNLWNNLHSWAQSENLPSLQKKFVQDQSELYKFLSQKNNSKLHYLIKIVRDPGIIDNKGFIHIHQKYFGNNIFSILLYKIITRSRFMLSKF